MNYVEEQNDQENQNQQEPEACGGVFEHDEEEPWMIGAVLSEEKDLNTEAEETWRKSEIDLLETNLMIQTMIQDKGGESGNNRKTIVPGNKKVVRFCGTKPNNGWGTPIPPCGHNGRETPTLPTMNMTRSRGCNCAPPPDEAGMPKPPWWTHVSDETVLAERKRALERQWKAAAAVKAGRPQIEMKNKFGALQELEDDEPGEVNAVEKKVTFAKSEDNEITVDSGASRNVWPKQRKEGGKISEAAGNPKLMAANGTAIPISGEKVVKFANNGRKCAMKFLVTTVKKPLAAVSTIVDEGNVVVFGPGKDDSFIQCIATGDRIPMRRKRGTYVIDADFAAGATAKKMPKDDGGQRPMEIGAIQGDAAVFRRRA